SSRGGLSSRPTISPRGKPVPGAATTAPAYIADGLPGPAATEFMDDVAQPLLDFIKSHSDWAALVMFVTAFGESFAFLSLLFPGTAVLVAAWALLSAGALPYASILIGAIFGAVLGDSVSYWFGRHFGGGIARVWPFSRHPELLSRGILFFERHGGKSVFIGRFFG